MTMLFILLIFFIHASSLVYTEVILIQGSNETISFKGHELVMRLNNPNNIRYESFVVCFQSISKSENFKCPQGYAAFSFYIDENMESNVFILNRNGLITTPTETLFSTVDFSEDGTLNIYVKTLPKNVSLTLVNAKKIGKKETANNTNKTIIGVVVGIGLLAIVALLTVGFILWFCVFRRTPTHTVVPTTAPEEEFTRTTDTENVREEIKNVPKTTPIACQNVKPQQQTFSQNQASTVRTKPSVEKLQSNATLVSTHVTDTNIKPTSNVILNQPQADTPLYTPPTSTPKIIANILPSCRGKTPKPSTPKIPTPRTPPTTTTITKMSPNFPVDSTQSETIRSPLSEPTPDFGTDVTAKALASNSEYRSRRYLRRSETPRIGSHPKRRNSRIIDEVDEYRRSTETYVCFGERIKILNGHNHLRLVERINVEIQHETSNAERALLKADPKDAPALANKVVQEANARFTIFSVDKDCRKISWHEGAQFWNMINHPSTPASDGYIVMYRIAPEIFKLEKHSLSDGLVKQMPLCGIYVLILDENLPHSFRVQLAGELRNRASKVIPYIQKDALRDTSFPTSYLARVFHKNNKSFIEGSEIHSKSSILL